MLCGNNKEVTNRKNIEKHCIRRYDPPLNAASSKWLSSQNNWPPLT